MLFLFEEVWYQPFVYTFLDCFHSWVLRQLKQFLSIFKNESFPFALVAKQ